MGLKSTRNTMKYYLVYGDGCDYIVVDGLWTGEDVAKRRAEFLNQYSDPRSHVSSRGYLALDWTYEEVPLNQTNIFREPNPDSSGWILK